MRNGKKARHRSLCGRLSGIFRSGIGFQFRSKTCCVDAGPPLSRPGRPGEGAPSADGALIEKDVPPPSQIGSVNLSACSRGMRARLSSRQAVGGPYFVQRDGGALIFLLGWDQINSRVLARRTRTLIWGASLHLHRCDWRVLCPFHAFSRAEIVL